MTLHIEHILSASPREQRPRGPWGFGWSFRIADTYRLWGLRAVFTDLQGRLLDYGCGDKPYEAHLGDGIAEWCGVDLEVRTSGEGHRSRADRFLKNDKIPYEAEEFDVVLATQVFEHVEDLDLCLSEISRVLKPGGSLVTTCPMTSPLHEVPHDYRRLTPYGMQSLASNHRLHLERSIALGGPVSTIATLMACYLGPLVKIPLMGRPLRWLVGGCILSLGWWKERILFRLGLRQTTLVCDFLYVLKKN